MLKPCTAILLLTGLAIAQTAPDPLRFEVADIQKSKFSDTEIHANFLPGGKVDVRNVPLKLLISHVYKVGDDMVEGPSWLASERFDIVAKAVPTSTEDQLLEMVKTMLVERFKMVSHKGSKVVPVYAMVVGKKGAKLTPAADPAAEFGCPMAAPVAGRNDRPGVIHRACHSGSMADLAKALPLLAPAYVQGLPVVDMTNLAGKFDFQLDWMGRGAYDKAVADNNGVPPSDGVVVSIHDALNHLGLALENRKMPQDTLVIDSILRTPTEN
jgi:uncharacterized protein (TIGR03435 family)